MHIAPSSDQSPTRNHSGADSRHMNLSDRLNDRAPTPHQPTSSPKEDNPAPPLEQSKSGDMSYQLDTPVLTVDKEIIHKVDAGNPQNLFSMWTVFSKCADSVQNGRRLEYMCWRYWNRATIRSELPEAASAPTTMQTPKPIHSSATLLPDVPQLSKSVDSVDEDAAELTVDVCPLDIRPTILRQDSCASRKNRSPRGDDFEKLFVSILKEESPLVATSAPRQPTPTPSLQRSGSTTTEESTNSFETVSPESQPSTDTPFRSTTVIRGFSPATATVEQLPSVGSDSSSGSSIRSASVSPASQASASVRGASAASSINQVGISKKAFPPKSRQALFDIGTSASSEEESSVKGAMHKSRSVTFLPQPRQPVFPQLSSRDMTANDSAIDDDSETEGDDFDESAIDDDEDDSDWEDSDEVSGKSSIDDKTYFKRVDSSANLVSRRSLITLGLAANERTQRLGNVTSHSTSAIHRGRGPHGVQAMTGSPNDSDEAPLMMKGMRQAQLKPIREAPRTAAQPIMARGANGHFQAALSPRTTRRHMLATELTESLRRHLLWERQQKSSTANAVLKRRHTSHDVANLKQYPDKAYMDKEEDDADTNTWNQYFAKEAFNGYHSKGW